MQVTPKAGPFFHANSKSFIYFSSFCRSKIRLRHGRGGTQGSRGTHRVIRLGCMLRRDSSVVAVRRQGRITCPLVNSRPGLCPNGTAMAPAFRYAGRVGSQLGCWPRPLEQQFSSCPEAGRVIVIGVSIVVFLVVCCLKTECGWRWRCGDRS